MGTIPALDECKPGFVPTCFNVLIAPETVEEKTAGGIILPARAKETNEMATVRGRLIAVSPLAFTYETWPEGSRKPQVGDGVIFAKYGGTLIEGDDGREYRLLPDKEIGAVISAS